MKNPMHLTTLGINCLENSISEITEFETKGHYFIFQPLLNCMCTVSHNFDQGNTNIE